MITIVYDNNSAKENMRSAWGFGCVVQDFEKTILFDTGGGGNLLLENMRKLGIDPRDIDVLALSHIHGDHTGGLDSFLRACGTVPVYIPSGFPDSFKQRIRYRGGEPIEADAPSQICPGVNTTGTLGKGAIEEQGLCLDSSQGSVLITGCAHPGIVEMARRAKELSGRPLSLLIGGFHMDGYSKGRIETVIEQFQKLRVRGVAPCHCTGQAARGLFKQHFGDECSLAGVGSILRLGREPAPVAKENNKQSDAGGGRLAICLLAGFAVLLLALFCAFCIYCMWRCE